MMGCSLKAVGETSETECVFPVSFNILSIRKRKGRSSVSPVEGQPFPHAWSQKDVLIGHFLEWLLEIHPAVNPLNPVTFLRQEENNEGIPPQTGKPKSKHSNKPLPP